MFVSLSGLPGVGTFGRGSWGHKRYLESNRAAHAYSDMSCRQHRHMLGSRLSSTSSVWSRQHGRATSTTVHAGRDVDIADRAVASLPYLVPLFDGLKYGELSFVFPSAVSPAALPCLMRQHCFVLVPVRQHGYPKQTTRGRNHA